MRVGAQWTWGAAHLFAAALLCLALAAPAKAEFEFVDEFGQPGPDEVAIPFDVEADGAGGAYVYDLLLRRVQHFDAAGALVNHWRIEVDGEAALPAPSGIAVAPSGDVYVSAVGGSFETGPKPRILRFDSNGNFVSGWGAFGSAEGEFSPVVSGLSVDSAGNVYAVDRSQNRVQKFDADGVFERMWGKDVETGGATGFEVCTSGCKAGEIGVAAGEFNDPEDVVTHVFMGSDRVVVTDSENHRVQQFDGSGGFIQAAGKGVAGGAGFEQCMIANCQAGDSGGSLVGEFDRPIGIGFDPTVAAERIYVADSADEHVHVLNHVLGALTTIDGAGTAEGELSALRGIGADESKLFTTESAPGRVRRFAEVGTFEALLGPIKPGSLTLASGLAAGSAQILVSTETHPIARFDPSGAFLGSWGAFGSGPGEFSLPAGLAIDGGGAYVADSGNDRIQRLDSAGNAISIWGGTGSAQGELSSPADVARGADGSIYVSDRSNDRVQKFSPIGGFLGTWGVNGSAPGQFQSPLQLAVGPDDTVYVADSNNHRVQRFDSSGALLGHWGTEGGGDGEMQDPSGVAVDGLGNVFVADRGNHRVQRFDADGTFLGKWGAGGGNGNPGAGEGEFFFPNRIDVDPAGDIYVLDSGNLRVQKFAGADRPPEPPMVAIKLPKRAKHNKLRTTIRCGDAPCAAVLGGKVNVKLPAKGKKARSSAKRGKARKVKLKLQKRRFDLLAGDKRKQKLKLKRHKRSTRKLGRLLRRKGKVRAKLVVSVGATNEAGSDKAKAKTKVKRPKKKGKKKTKKG